MHVTLVCAIIPLCSGISLRHNLHEVLELLESPTSNATTHFFNEAVLDHFGSDGARLWDQRFFVDQSMWCGEGCPIFLMIGGEGTERAPSKHMFMGYLAEKHQAMMVSLEHRFYGESFPTSDMSNSNLKYLTSEQALADLAHFVQHLTSFSYSTKGGIVDSSATPSLLLKAATHSSKVVTFGGSYPGNLAAWFGLKYPQLIVGTVASSAPGQTLSVFCCFVLFHFILLSLLLCVCACVCVCFLVYAEYDYQQYAEVVGTALGHAGTCVYSREGK